MVSKKILFIIPEMSMGGAQRSLSRLSIEFARHHDVKVVIFNADHHIGYPVGGEIINLDVGSGPGIIRKSVAFYKRVKRLKKIKKELGTQISISFLEGADYINILSRVNDKVVISVRGSKRYDENIAGNFSWLRNQILIPFLYRYADVIVTVNQGIASELRNFYSLTKQRIVTLSNFYDLQEINKLANEEKPPAVAKLYTKPVLLVTGRLAPEKGLISLLRIFHRVKQKLPEAVFIIVGNGPYFPVLLEECSRLRLNFEQSVEFESMPEVLFLRNEQNVFKYLKGASVYIMNSSAEGFPNGLAEAMVCGVPVISADCPYGPREILAPDFPFRFSVTQPFFSDHGILMPVVKNDHDLQVWAQMLIYTLNERDVLSKIAASAYQRIATYKKEDVISEWNKLLAAIT